MKILLDEQTPVIYVKVLELACPGHEVRHIDDLGWKGKPDRNLLPDAAGRGFHAFLTNDHNQLSDPVEVKAIKRSGLHHVTYRIKPGTHGIPFALASVAAAMPGVVEALAAAKGPQLVTIKPIPGRVSDRFEVVDPSRNPYWR